MFSSTSSVRWSAPTVDLVHPGDQAIWPLRLWVLECTHHSAFWLTTKNGRKKWLEHGNWLFLGIGIWFGPNQINVAEMENGGICYVSNNDSGIFCGKLTIKTELSQNHGDMMWWQRWYFSTRVDHMGFPLNCRFEDYGTWWSTIKILTKTLPENWHHINMTTTTVGLVPMIDPGLVHYHIPICFFLPVILF